MEEGRAKHVAIIMDGNGRWAQEKRRPRTFGHQAGLKALRKIVEHCGRLEIGQLTVFAFSSENWNRPAAEVSRLMDLFMRALDREARELHENNVRVRFIGDLSGFSRELRTKIDAATRMKAFGRMQEILIEEVAVLPIREAGVVYVQHEKLANVRSSIGRRQPLMSPIRMRSRLQCCPANPSTKM